MKLFSLKERPVSPPVGTNNATLSTASLPSPLANSDSPISGTTQGNPSLLGSNTGPNVSLGSVYRPGIA